MEEPSINVLVDAKTEYTKQLTNTLAPLIKEGFDSLYEDACKFKEDTNDPRYDDYSELQIFQDYLRKIPKWNQSIIDDETKRIISKSQCEWLEELLAAVFISNAKVLSVIRLKNPSNQMKLKIPKLRNFIHKCYVECSREIYQNVYLFDNDEVSTIEKQKNVRDVMNIVKEGIIESVRKLLPIREIIKTYLGKIYDDEDTENTTMETGFEQNLFMDFAKNNLRQNVEEIHSDNEIPEQKTQPQDMIEDETSLSDTTSQEESDNISEKQNMKNNNKEDDEQNLAHSSVINNYSEDEDEDEDVEYNDEEDREESGEIENEELIDKINIHMPPQVETKEDEEIDLMNFKPKVDKKLEEPPQLSNDMIRQIEENQEAIPKKIYEKKDDNTHYEVVSLAGSDKSSNLSIVNIKGDNEQELLKTIVNREKLEKKENTLSSTDENVKKIIFTKDEEKQNMYEMDKKSAREQRRKEKEERRARRKILRNKDKKKVEQTLPKTIENYNDNDNDNDNDNNKFMFFNNGAEYVEDI